MEREASDLRSALELMYAAYHELLARLKSGNHPEIASRQLDIAQKNAHRVLNSVPRETTVD